MDGQLNYKLEKLRSGQFSEKERKDILTCFHLPEQEFGVKGELYLQLVNSKDVHGQYGESQAMFDRLWKRIESEKLSGKTFKLSYVYWAAAILFIGFLAGNLIQPDLKKEAGPAFCTAISPKGSVSEIILSDQSIIYLNAGSEIKYASGTDQRIREVFLKGEAWFDVEKSEEVPFIVHTPFYDIRVLGTEFNVKAYAEDTEVVTTLEEGVIHIEATENFKTERNIILQPGEQLVFNKQSKALFLNKVNTAIFSSWKDNKLIFINMSLAELFILLERKYGVEIEVPDQSILNYHYDGTIKNETIMEVLNILQKTLSIEYEIKDQKVRILKK